ncbi:MAG: transcriptional repressor [Geodermatophilaceae bacterium]|nr:transcriptional repressor [Geodermatophilaceae bacterium]MDQ3477057.1 transcriptional repressor [Actinomycetota bacterium]
MTPVRVRATRQRTAVSDLLAELSDFRSAQDIHHLLRGQGDGIGLSTVYRTLQTLSEAGEVDTIQTADGESVYRKCSDLHHHHLVCRECGHTVEVAGPAVERWADRTAAENGFTDVSHTLEIFGLCAECRGKQR